MKIRFSHEQGSDRVKADQLMTRARLIQPFGSRNDFSSYPSGIIRSTPPHTPHLPAGSLGSGSVGTEGVTTTPRDHFNPWTRNILVPRTKGISHLSGTRIGLRSLSQGCTTFATIRTATVCSVGPPLSLSLFPRCPRRNDGKSKRKRRGRRNEIVLVGRLLVTLFRSLAWDTVSFLLLFFFFFLLSGVNGSKMNWRVDIVINVRCYYK